MAILVTIKYFFIVLPIMISMVGMKTVKLKYSNDEFS